MPIFSPAVLYSILFGLASLLCQWHIIETWTLFFLRIACQVPVGMNIIFDVLCGRPGDSIHSHVKLFYVWFAKSNTEFSTVPVVSLVGEAMHMIWLHMISIIGLIVRFNSFIPARHLLLHSAVAYDLLAHQQYIMSLSWSFEQPLLTA